MCGTDIFLGIIAIIFPPIAVWVKKGICSADSLINIALCCLGFLPGLFHAWYIIYTTPDPTYEELAQEDAERGNVTYYYVRNPAQRRQGQQAAPQGYGAMDNTPPAQFPAHDQGFVQPPPAERTAGPSDEVPPSYQQAMGDHKQQRP